MPAAEWIALASLLVAVVSFWRWQRWKARARSRQQDVEVWREALRAVAFESTNALNAIRAHLNDFRQVNPEVNMPEHLNEIAEGTRRIARVLEIAEDPHTWYRENRARPKRATPVGTTEFAAPMVGEREVN